MRGADWILTSAGHQFFPLRPERSRVDILDIAHALAHTCRFAGHTREFYSVAQHSVLVAEIVKQLGGSPVEEFAGLLHDAAEAYLLDLPTPVKRELPQYAIAEKLVRATIGSAFDLPAEDPPVVKTADGIALATEARDLMPAHPCWRALPHKPVKPRLTAWGPRDAKGEFLWRYHRLRVMGVRA